MTELDKILNNKVDLEKIHIEKNYEALSTLPTNYIIDDLLLEMCDEKYFYMIKKLLLIYIVKHDKIIDLQFNNNILLYTACKKNIFGLVKYIIQLSNTTFNLTKRPDFLYVVVKTRNTGLVKFILNYYISKRLLIFTDKTIILNSCLVATREILEELTVIFILKGNTPLKIIENEAKKAIYDTDIVDIALRNILYINYEKWFNHIKYVTNGKHIIEHIKKNALKPNRMLIRNIGKKYGQIYMKNIYETIYFDKKVYVYEFTAQNKNIKVVSENLWDGTIMSKRKRNGEIVYYGSDFMKIQIFDDNNPYFHIVENKNEK